MRRAPQLVSLAVLAALLVAALSCAQVALAAFTHSASSGELTLATSTLAAPTALSASQLKCHIGKTPEIELSWSASSSSYAASYSVERATSSNGSYSALASIASSQSSYTDKSAALAYSTTYYYRVSAGYHSWSAASSVKSVKTLSGLCQ